MRKHGLCLSILFLTVAFMFTTAHALVINEGESVILDLHELVYYPEDWHTPRLELSVTFSTDGLVGGEWIRFEFFDELTDEPIMEDWNFGSVTPPAKKDKGRRSAIGFDFGYPVGAFADRAAFLRITMISGSVNVSELTFGIVDQNGVTYRQTLKSIRDFHSVMMNR